MNKLEFTIAIEIGVFVAIFIVMFILIIVTEISKRRRQRLDDDYIITYIAGKWRRVDK